MVCFVFVFVLVCSACFVFLRLLRAVSEHLKNVSLGRDSGNSCQRFQWREAEAAGFYLVITRVGQVGSSYLKFGLFELASHWL